MRANIYLGILVLFLLISPSASAEDPSPGELRATYAMLLVEIAEAEGGSYSIDCGNAEILNRGDPLSDMDGYEPIVCVLDMGDEQAVIFAVEGTTIPDVIIAHFANYGDPIVDNINIIKADDLDVDACNDPEIVGEGFGRCDGAIDNKPGYEVTLYNKIGQPATYLVTINFSPFFDEGWWGDVLNFFKNLLGIGGETAPDGKSINSFERGYFAYAEDGGRERWVHAFFHADDMDSTGSASIIYKNFVLDLSTLAGDAEYTPGRDNTQVLIYETITADTWHKLTAALRLEAIEGTPHPGDECGNVILGYGEDCERDGIGFLGDAQTCEELGMSYGTLACNTDCTYDTSNCVSCANEDDDGYWTAEGIPSELKAVNDMLVGSHAADTIYDNSMTGHSDDYTLRQALNIEAQSIPLPLNHFTNALFTSTFNAASNALLAGYESCVAENTITYCLGEAFAPETVGGNAIAQLGGLVAQEMLQGAVTDEGQCTWGSVSWKCTSGLQPSSFGYAMTSYKEFLITMAEEGIEPIFFLDNRPYRLTETNKEVIESALACAALARGVKNTWEHADVAVGTNYENVSANTYVYGYRHGFVDSEDMLPSYQACRSGIHAAQNARLYYYPKTLLGVGRVVVHDHYTQLAEIVLQDPEGAKGMIDGLITDNPEPYAVPSKEVKTEEGERISFIDLRKAIGAQLIVIVNNTDVVTTGHKHIVSARANTYALLFRGIETPVSGYPLGTGTELTPEGDFLVELINNVADKNMFVPSDKSLPQSRMLIANTGTGTNVLIAQIIASSPNIFPLEDCEDATIEEAQDDGTFTLIEEITGDVGVYRYNITDWSCFLEDAQIGVCTDTIQEFDCNDNDASINPGAIEDCDDGIDNDCDGLVDLADDCEFDPLPPVEGCDFDGICEPDNENVYTCSDCIGYFPCPRPVTGVNQIGKVGHYNLSMRWDEDGVPQLIIDPDGLRPSGNAYDCQWGDPDPNYPSGILPVDDKKEFAYTPSLLNNPKTQVAFRDSNGDYASVSVRSYFDAAGFTGWKLYYFGNGDQSAMRCWGLGDPNFRGNIGEDMDIFEFGHCSEQRCFSQEDCTAGSICTRLSDDYDFKVCLQDDFFGGGDIECFTPETTVKMVDGTEKAIEELSAGDHILGFNEMNEEQRTQTIIDVLIHDTGKGLLLINNRIQVTPEHRFYTQRGWFTAGELVIGDELFTSVGEKEIVESIQEFSYEGKVYNLHTEPDNNYYAAGVLVHNMKPRELEDRDIQ